MKNSGGSPSERRDEDRLDPQDMLVRELVPWVAETVQDEPESGGLSPFDERARAAAERLGPDGLTALARHIFHYFPASSPKALRLEREERFGFWPDACRSALFTIMYHLGPVCLSFVRSVAFGRYDWTQIDAIRVLCRFGVDGIEREQIAQELADHLLEWDWDDVTRFALPALCEFAPLAPSLVVLFDGMIEGSDPYTTGVNPQRVPYDPECDRMTLLVALFDHAPEVARRYERTLREIMRREGRTPPEEVQELMAPHQDNQEEGGNATSCIDYIDHDAIQAAFILVDLFPHDVEATVELRAWQESHPSERARRFIADELNKAG